MEKLKNAILLARTATRGLAILKDKDVDISEEDHDVVIGCLQEQAIGYVDGSGGGLWREKLKTSYPSDYFELDKDTWALALETFDNTDSRGIGIPTDLFDADMVPMEDCLLYLSDMGCYARVCAKHGYFVMDMEVGGAHVASVFEIKTGLFDEKASLIPYDVKVVRGADLRLSLAEYQKYMGCADSYLVYDDILKAWYGLMILLLNPGTQEVLMERKGKEKLRQKCLCPKKNRERKAIYVKRHKLDGDIWDEVSKRNGIERRTLAWYVIGHWREYSKTGKRVYIKPYWKGPLRELQRNVDTNRKREVKVTAVKGGKAS